MYFDPTLRQTETKADPFKLGTLIAWLEKQPADKIYCYSEPGDCLLATYFGDHGFSAIAVTPAELQHSGGEDDLPPHFDAIACMGTRTYGAALTRARYFGRHS